MRILSKKISRSLSDITLSSMKQKKRFRVKALKREKWALMCPTDGSYFVEKMVPSREKGPIEELTSN
ncbi:hypothetical protein VcTj87_11830 [Vibrio comitans]